jgi:hypothetical protein
MQLSGQYRTIDYGCSIRNLGRFGFDGLPEHVNSSITFFESLNQTLFSGG